MQIKEQPTTPIDWDKPIEDMEGNPARVISEDYRTTSGFARIVQVELRGKSQVHSVDKKGFHTEGFHTAFRSQQIRNRKTKREGWINIFPDQWVGCSHGSEEAARRHPNAKGAIATIKIEWEE